jgi:hypothetical protein
VKDFGRWFNDADFMKAPPEAPNLDEKLEELGFWVRGLDEVWVECCRCKRSFCLTQYISKEECLEADPDEQYCGRSERCCP